MSTDFDSISQSINLELTRIEENQIERNRKFQNCLESYLDHLKKEIHQIDSTEQKNNQRNQLISSAFQNVYDRIMTSSQLCLRKIKETCYQKKQFWTHLIKNNADSSDLELKKDFYQKKRDAEDLYEDAIENQKTKKMSYDILLGKLKDKNNLKNWQDNNKKLEQEVTKGTKTMKQWNIGESNLQKNKNMPIYIRDQSQYIVEKQLNSRPLLHQTYDKDMKEGILGNFKRHQ